LQKEIQRESMDDALRNRLWNIIKLCIWDNYRTENPERCNYITSLCKLLWHNYFKETLDSMPSSFKYGYTDSSYEKIKDYFLTCAWNEVYDITEFILQNCLTEWSGKLKASLNSVLESERSAYRVVGLEITDISSEEEVREIETTLAKGTKAVSAHINQALAHLADRKNPDLRNSIKESILAVEAACRTFTGMPKATMGDCIKQIKTKAAIHPAFEKAFLSLYGYSSDEGGIRHSLTENSTEPSYADARFMLIACSAFTNFLWTKAAELGIEIK